MIMTMMIMMNEYEEVNEILRKYNWKWYWNIMILKYEMILKKLWRSMTEYWWIIIYEVWSGIISS